LKQLGLDGSTIGSFFKAKLQSGQDKQLLTAKLNFNKTISIISGTGRTEY